MPTTIVVVDDHEMLRAGVCDFLVSIPEYKLAGEASSARDALDLIESQRPDIVLMDIAMPGMDGFAATREILRRAPRTRIVVLTAHGQRHNIDEAIDAGVIGFVLKADSPETLREALDHAAQGDFYIPPSLRVAMASLETAPTAVDVLGLLSERETEIFRLAADCSTAAEIAQQLGIARKTVDAHLNSIGRKLGLHGRADLVRLAVSIGLVYSVRSRIGEQRRRRPVV